jgi:hypothetical protein
MKGKRTVDNRTILDKFVEDFCEVIDKHVKYIICSGFVAIAHGRPRGTEDIDMIIEKIDEEKLAKMHADLKKHGFVCIQSDSPGKIFQDYLEQGNSVRYVKDDKGFFPPEMEIKFPKDSLDEEQLEDRVKLPLTELNVFFSSIESNIAFKEEYLCSEKDLEDAKHLRIVYKDKIDEDKIKTIKEKIVRRKNERQKSY